MRHVLGLTSVFTGDQESVSLYLDLTLDLVRIIRIQPKLSLDRTSTW